MKINYNMVICPGCGKTWERLGTYLQEYNSGVEYIQCQCGYEIGFYPERLLSLQEILVNETERFNDVQLGKFVKSLLNNVR